MKHTESKPFTWGIYARESLSGPLIVLYVTVIFMILSPAKTIDTNSLIAGIGLGFGIGGLLFRHVYYLKKRDHSESTY